MVEKNSPNGFTLKLALTDAIPVILFSITVSILSLNFDSILFRLGSFLIILAGTLKVLWKLLMVYGHNIRFLARQLRYLMPLGFLLQLLSVLLDRTGVLGRAIAAAVSLPTLLFFLAGIVLMGVMFYMARHKDQLNASDNAREQLVNCLMQLCFLLGVVL